MTKLKQSAFIPRRVFQVLWHWIVFLLPLVVILAGALLLFREAVIRAIVSTQHPELVYIILGAFLAGVILATLALVRYTKEGNLIHLWVNGYADQRGLKFEQKVEESFLQPIYAILSGVRALPVAVQQQVIEREVASIQVRLQEQLTLPQFLAGAMVGLGLVGTFVGLLGTLEDLGKIFSVSPAAGGTDNPVEMFSGMMGRLQAPMKGMGTAFVASLFGLLGSLVLGLQILLASKVGHSVTEQIHALIRQESQEEAFPNFTPVAVGQDQIQINLGQSMQPILDAVRATQSLQNEQLEQWQLVSEELKQLQASHLKDYQNLRNEVLAMVEATNTIAAAMQQNISADERYRASVPRTSYWQDAWVKVQAYLQRSNIDDTLAHLSEANKAQLHIMTAVLKTLTNIEHRLRVTRSSPEIRRH